MKYKPPIKNTAEIGALNKNDLLDLLNNAYKEASRIDSVFNHYVLNDYYILAEINEIIWEKETLADAIFYRILPPLMVFDTFRFYSIPELNKATSMAKRCKILKLLPQKYRTTYAIKFMIEYLNDGIAKNWDECVEFYSSHNEIEIKKS